MTEIERHPDKRPADGGYDIEDRGTDVVLTLHVRGLGALVIRGSSMKDWHGVSIFTDEQIAFSDAPLDISGRL